MWPLTPQKMTHMHASINCFGLKTKEMSKVRSIKLLFVYCASSEYINDEGSVVHYSHRNAIVIESVQFLANPHLVYCLGMRNSELIWKRLTCNLFCTQSSLWFINFCFIQHANDKKSDDIVFAVYMGAYMGVSMILPNEIQTVYGGSFFTDCQWVRGCCLVQFSISVVSFQVVVKPGTGQNGVSGTNGT